MSVIVIRAWYHIVVVREDLRLSRVEDVYARGAQDETASGEQCVRGDSIRVHLTLLGCDAFRIAGMALCAR
jgi:hypothetical protein